MNNFWKLMELAMQGELVVSGLLLLAVLLLGLFVVVVLALWRGREIRWGQFGYWRADAPRKRLATLAETRALRSQR